MVWHQTKVSEFRMFAQKSFKLELVSSPDSGTNRLLTGAEAKKRLSSPKIMVNDVYSIGGTSSTAHKFVDFYVFRDVKGKQQICDAGVLFIDFSLVATSLGGRTERERKVKILEFSLKTGVVFSFPRMQLRFIPVPG